MDERQLLRKERKRKEKIWAFTVFFICLFFIIGLISGGFYFLNTYLIRSGQKEAGMMQTGEADNGPDTDSGNEGNADNEGTASEAVPQEDAASGLSDTEISEKIETAIAAMTLEEKIGQMFMVPLNKLNNDEETQSVTETVLTSLLTYHVGGVVFTEENIHDEEQLQAAIGQLQEERTVPLFIAVNEESGDASLLAGEESVGLTSFPNQKEMGESGDYNQAYEYGATIGQELKNIGFNLNFAPVTDVNLVSNSVVGERSFGEDAAVVSDMVRETVMALQEKNISSVLKYFPGLGSATGDPSQGASTVKRTLTQLEETELLPYKAGIEAGADFIMVGHMALPKITNNSEPASLSSEIVTELLRNDLSFTGIIITDELTKKAISDRYNAADAAIKAVNAGADVLLMPASLKSAYQAVLSAVQNGDISEDRIEESVRRILEVKYKRI